MKARTLLIGTAFVLGVTGARAQWVVTDPGNLAQSIINMSDNIAHKGRPCAKPQSEPLFLSCLPPAPFS